MGDDLPTLRLAPELIPRPLFGHSAHRLLPGTAWRRVRARELDRSGPACEVCGRQQAKGLVAHERWLHRPDPPVAVLAAIRMQCRPCDAATHIGLADGQGRGRQARATLVRVNGNSWADAELLIEAAYERWAQLSSLTGWTADVMPALLATHPELAVVRDTPVAG